MKRVVERLPDPEEMAACGLTKRDFRVDAAIYRHFVAIYHRDVRAFALQFRGAGQPGAEGLPAEEACQAAFAASQPPYHYHQGVFYRYRVEEPARTDRPILLEGYDREEITGWIGIPPGPYHRSILLAFLGWMGTWLGGARKKEREKGKEPPPR